jgi:hypothetical protein
VAEYVCRASELLKLDEFTSGLPHSVSARACALHSYGYQRRDRNEVTAHY